MADAAEANAAEPVPQEEPTSGTERAAEPMAAGAAGAPPSDADAADGAAEVPNVAELEPAGGSGKDEPADRVAVEVPTVEATDAPVEASQVAKPDAEKPAASPRKNAAKKSEQTPTTKPGARARLPEEGAPAGRQKSKERAGEPDADALVELPEVTAIEVTNDAKLSKEMQQLLKDLNKKQNWIVRATALRKLQGFVLGGVVGSFPSFLKAIKSSEFSSATKDLFSELRSQLVKEVCETVLAFAKGVLDANAIKDYDQYFTDIVLVEAFRAVCKANVAIVASADMCLKGLAKDFHSLRMLRGVVEPMVDSKANSRLRLECAQLLTIILESWAPDKFNKSSIDIANKRVDALDAIEDGILKCLSDNKPVTRNAAKVCHDKYVELFSQRAPRLLERMNRQQLRIVREGVSEVEGEDQEGANKRKPRISSVSPERKAAGPTSHPVTEAERQKRRRDKELAERARARGAAKGDGKEVDPADALVLVQGELAEAKDKLEQVEKQLAEERRKSKNLQKLKDDAVKNRDQEKQALEMVLEQQKAAAEGGDGDAAKEAASGEMEEKIKDLQRRLKQEQARAKKMMEERDEWQRKCKAAENSLEGLKGKELNLVKAVARDDKKEDKRERRGRRAEGDEGGEKGDKKSIRQEKEEASAAEIMKQLESKNKKLLEKLKGANEEVKAANEGVGLLEEEKKLVEEKLASLEKHQERAKVELDLKLGELRQVKDRWQVREKDWFEARMNLEREVEMLKAELKRQQEKSERSATERQGLLKRVENLRARLGEDNGEEEREEVYDEYSAENLAKRKMLRERGGADGDREREESLSDVSGAGSGARQLKMELEEVKQQLMRQEAMAAEARATASLAQQELQHWRQRVQELEPECNRATHIADKLRAELEWRGRVQGQEERRLRAHAQHAEEGRRRVEAQLAYISMELQRGQLDVSEGRIAPEAVIKKVEMLMNEEQSRVKLHRNADAFLAADVGMPHPMLAHHAVAPPLFPPAAPVRHGAVGGLGRAAGAKNALPWAAFDEELGNDFRLPPIAPGGGGGVGNDGGDGSPLKKRHVRASNGAGARGNAR